MQMTRRAWIRQARLALVLCALGGAVTLKPNAAHAESLEIWVAPGFYGVNDSNCRPDVSSVSVAVLTKIDARLCAVLNEQHRAEFSDYFAHEMAASSFAPYLVATPGAKLSASTAISQRLRSTLVASLHISRADIWEVDKSNGSREVHLPNTVSLLLTNVSTGEVVFTETRSLIPNGLTLSTNVSRYAQDQLPDQIRTNISALVKQAAQRFHPYPVSATVQGSFDGKYVIDKGRSAGIRRGDHFRDDMKVLFADADYSVVLAGLDAGLKPGTSLEMQNVQPAEYLSKHSAMVIMGAPPEGMSATYLKQTFEEKLGATTLFSISPVNPSLSVIRTLAAAAAKSDANGEDRHPPEYFVYVQSFVTDGTRTATNIPNIVLKTFEAYSIGEIVDKAGRVLYSRVASDRIVDQVAAGIGFPDDQRQDTVVRNSLEKLAGMMQAEFKPISVRLPIEQIGSDSVVADAGGMLSTGTNGIILHKVGSFSGVKGVVWAPVGDVSRVEIESGRAVIRGAELDGAPSKGDLFAIEGGGVNAGQSRRAFKLCSVPTGLPENDLSGSPLIRAIGEAVFASAARVPVYIDGLPALAKAQMSTFTGTDKLGVAQARSPDICFKPIFRFSPLGPGQTSRELIANRYALAVGYTLNSANGEKLSGYGMQFELLSSPVPALTPPNEMHKGDMREFFYQMNRLSPETVSKLVIP